MLLGMQQRDHRAPTCNSRMREQMVLSLQAGHAASSSVVARHDAPTGGAACRCRPLPLPLVLQLRLATRDMVPNLPHMPGKECRGAPLSLFATKPAWPRVGSLRVKRQGGLACVENKDRDHKIMSALQAGPHLL